MRRFPNSLDRGHRQWGLRVLALIFCFLTIQHIAIAEENTILRLLEDRDTGDLKLRAEAGDLVAQEDFAGRLFAALYFYEAAKQYRSPAEAGRAHSQFQLGSLLLTGRPKMGDDRPGLAAQPRAAIDWLTKAANQDHGQAQLRLGRCHEDGTGVAKNLVAAYKWYSLAAEKTVVARSYRDRLALKLSTVQIQEGKRLAERFRAGDRNDSRILIVTQTDLAATGTQQEPAFSSPLPESDLQVASDRMSPPPSNMQRPAPVVATATTSPAQFPVRAGKKPLALLKRALITVVVFTWITLFGAIALVLLLRRRRHGRAKKVTPHSVRPSTIPPVAEPSQTVRDAGTVAEPDPLRDIDWFQFEKLMALLFQRERYRVDRRGGAQPDGGVDLELSRDGLRTAVQCKHWKTQRVGVREVREFLGAIAAGRFDCGILVTTNRCTIEALTFARENCIEILDGQSVTRLLNKHDARYDPELQAALDPTDKRCPKCESPLVWRRATKGANVGNVFQGCSSFPKCRFVMGN